MFYKLTCLTVSESGPIDCPFSSFISLSRSGPPGYKSEKKERVWLANMQWGVLACLPAVRLAALSRTKWDLLQYVRVSRPLVVGVCQDFDQVIISLLLKKQSKGGFNKISSVIILNPVVFQISFKDMSTGLLLFFLGMVFNYNCCLTRNF